MDPLEIKIEPPEFVINVFHNFSEHEIENGSEGNYVDPLEVKNEATVLVNDDFQYFNENGINNENQENGDFSSEQTLISVSFSLTNS